MRQQGAGEVADQGAARDVDARTLLGRLEQRIGQIRDSPGDLGVMVLDGVDGVRVLRSGRNNDGVGGHSALLVQVADHPSIYYSYFRAK